MSKQKIMILVLFALFIVLVLWIVIWLNPNIISASSHSTKDTSSIISNHDSFLTENKNKIAHPAVPASVPALASYLNDTQIDCHLHIDNQQHFIADKQTKACFEYFLTQYGDLSLTAIDTQIRDYFNKNLPEFAANQVSDLWQRYLKYRDAEGHLQVPGDNNDPKHLENVLQEITQLRKTFFNSVELDALFGEETIYNQYTIDRVNIMANAALSPNEKAQQLKARLEQLPEDLQKNIADINKLQDLRALTKEIQQHHGSAAELRQMREQLVGNAAADRLEQLDTKREQWQQRVDAYLTQRDRILKSVQSVQDQQRAIDELRQRSFLANEQERAKSFETFKDQHIDSQRF